DACRHRQQQRSIDAWRLHRVSNNIIFRSRWRPRRVSTLIAVVYRGSGADMADDLHPTSLEGDN
ncbi:MAG: hypothetical protein WA693_12355, partial [Pseudolabrys sp.]